jgi:hypothetical protein
VSLFTMRVERTGVSHQPKSSGSLAMPAAIRRAPSRVSNLARDRTYDLSRVKRTLSR